MAINGTSYSYESRTYTKRINTIFANAETVAGKDGGNLTALGKAGLQLPKKKKKKKKKKKLQAEIDKTSQSLQLGIHKNF